MQKPILALLMLNVLLPLQAAESEGLTHFYGNTWQLHRPEETIWIYANVDGTWDGIFDGTFYNGLKWRTDGAVTCFFNPPNAQGVADEKGVCFRDLAGRKPGEKWKLTVVGLDKVWDASLIEGRKVPPDRKPE